MITQNKKHPLTRVGSIMGRKLRSLGIDHKDNSRCNCYQISLDMNKRTPDQIEEEIDRWVLAVKNSSRKWMKSEGLARKPLGMLPEFAIRAFILWACKEARIQEERLKNG